MRPEHISVGTFADASSAKILGQIILVEPLGSDTLGLVKLGNGQDAGEITGRFPPEAGLKVGENLDVSLQMNRFHLFDPESGLTLRDSSW